MDFKAEEGSGINSKHFVKLKDRESIIGVFRGNPYDFRQHWINNKSEVCVASGCKHCAGKLKSTFRFRLNFVTKEGEQRVVKIFEQGWTVYSDLKTLNGEYNLDRTIVKIVRQGTDRDTRYSILPIPNHQVSDQMDKEVALMPLHDLECVVQENEQQTPTNSPPLSAYDDLPF